MHLLSKSEQMPANMKSLLVKIAEALPKIPWHERLLDGRFARLSCTAIGRRREVEILKLVVLCLPTTVFL